MSHVFPRVLDRELPTAVRAEGAWIETADGERYLDGAGGAIVVNVGHGRREVIDAIEAQLAATQYVHGTMFTTRALEEYADAVASVLPMDDARIYPVSGGSESAETALKRDVVLAAAAMVAAIEAKVMPLLREGRVKPLMDSAFPLEKAADAHRRMETSAHIGKIVLEV